VLVLLLVIVIEELKCRYENVYDKGGTWGNGRPIESCTPPNGSDGNLNV